MNTNINDITTRIVSFVSYNKEIATALSNPDMTIADRLKLETARSVREDFLHQVAFDQVDTYTSLVKQYRMMQLILAYYDRALTALEQGAPVERVLALPVREKIGRFKYVPEEQGETEQQRILQALNREIESALPGEEENDAD